MSNDDKDPLKKTKVLAAAVLASNGKTPEEIAETIRGIGYAEKAPGISTIYRWLQEAVDEKWLAIEKLHRLIETEISPQLLDKVRIAISMSCQVLQDEVTTRMNELFAKGDLPIVPGIAIVQSISSENDPKTWDSRGNAVARFAARRFEFLAVKANINTLGIMWGKTLRSWVEHLAEGTVRLPNVKACIPLCPEPSYTDIPTPYPHLASTLAADLSKTNFPGADHFELPIFASIPKKYKKIQTQIRQLVREIAPYRKVFGSDGNGGLLDSTDVIVSSCGGATEAYTDPWLSDRLQAEGISKENWHKRILGDIGGTLFPRPTLNEQQRKQIEEINSRWLGARKIHLQKCSKRAHESDAKAIGVFVIAHGKSKAPILAQAIREHCVNELVCDDELARELLKIL